MDASVGKIYEKRDEISNFQYYEWEISDFHIVDEYFDSPAFSCCDAVWNLRVYPRGDDCSDFISLYLRSNDLKGISKSVMFTLGMKISSDTLVEKNAKKHTYTKDALSHGIQQFLRTRDQTESSTTFTLVFTCRMALQDSSPLEVDTQAVSSSGLENLSSNLRELFTSKKKCDVIIKVKGKEFQAHKAILMARSSVFAAMFEHDMLEETEGVVVIPDCDPDTFEDFLGYLYTGQMGDISFKIAQQLLITANKYDVEDLKSLCTNFMMHNMTVENMRSVLACQYDESEIRSLKQTFSKKVFDEIVQLLK